MEIGDRAADLPLATPSRRSFLSGPWLRRLDWSSLEGLTESVLRRIIRLACIVGSSGVVVALLSPQPANGLAVVFSALSIVAVFAATFLPIRLRALSIVYPSAMISTGVVLLAMLGPRIDAFLVLAGGMFIASLVLPTRGLVLVTALGWFGTLVIASQSHEPQNTEIWSTAIVTMIALVIPAAIMGRVLVAALARALKERQHLVDEVVAEREALQATIRDLETTRTQLTHAQKLELMSQLAGGIAHDMNNALTAIIGEASLLDDAVAEERERILEAGEYAAKLTHQLMVFARRDTSQPKPIDIVASLSGLLRAVRRVIPSDISLELDLAAVPIVVVADSTQLLQVLLNLATNAKDAMPSGGVLGVQLTLDTARGQAVLRVSDTGTGIAEEHLPRIFDPFFTTKPAGQGTGLGLPNVKHLVAGMGGEIQVETHVGKGTTFEVRLPLAEAEAVRPPDAKNTRSRRAGTILVVDDDVRVRAVAFTALQKVGHQVYEASSVAAALDVARLHGRRIDLLLTDVVMEGGGGAAVISAIREAVPGVRVLVMSGYADDETLRRGIAQGQFPFIAKPFTADMLSAEVDKILG